MISIITCSRKPHISKDLQDNIDQTIGTPYEIITINNEKNTHSIFSAYNTGGSLSKFEILCFMHDDILFHSKNWGCLVSQILEDRKIGVIGVAGSVYKSRDESPWWISNEKHFTKYHRFNILQHFKTGVEHLLQPIQVPESHLADVVVLDGVWLCCRKDFWMSRPFDCDTFKGFHFYDLDFSFHSHADGFVNKVCYDILIEHFSAGYLDKGWIESSRLFHEKWKSKLPAATVVLSQNESRAISIGAITGFLEVLKSNRLYTPKHWFPYWVKLFKLAPHRLINIKIIWDYIKYILKNGR